MASGLTEVADLVVEDGTGKDDANSYSSIATATAYTRLRQSGSLARWALADESNRVAALIIASDYVDRRWDRRWQYVGTISVEDAGSGDPQALAWPRNNYGGNIYDARGLDVTDTVPLQITEATIEYACRALDSTTYLAVPLYFDPEIQDNAGRFVKMKREKLGPLEEETRYSEARAIGSTRSYVDADKIIRNSGLLAGSGERAVRA
jgi:hypothetical protein